MNGRVYREVLVKRLNKGRNHGATKALLAITG
jgi:hypothetical protein